MKKYSSNHKENRNYHTYNDPPRSKSKGHSRHIKEDSGLSIYHALTPKQTNNLSFSNNDHSPDRRADFDASFETGGLSMNDSFGKSTFEEKGNPHYTNLLRNRK